MLDTHLDLIDKRLNELFIDNKEEYSLLLNAMNYSISAGGKRIRPCLLMEFSRVCGADQKDALQFACALEMIHTYSLIHDDLPCMDNDDMRRGKPSCHIKFGEANALLAGDALLTEAFNVALSTENVPFDRVTKAAKILAGCAGVHGMIGGQVIDLKYEKETPSLQSVMQMYRLKTGALLVAAAKIGCVLAGADDEKINNAATFAENVGLAFQIRDDILDITSSAEELGKPIGSDSENSKNTYVSFVGLEKAQSDVEKYTDIALKSLDIFGDEANVLKAFALNLINRRS